MSSQLTPFVPELLLHVRKQERLTSQWETTGSFVFADISGFTKLSEQLAELGKAGAEELTVLLNATFEALLGVARSEGGDLVKFGGDALFLFFNSDGHAERACRAAHGMRAVLKARGPVLAGRGRVVLKISMGVHSGPFMFVLAGSTQRELFVLGEHATIVTSMESDADAGEILVSPATAALLPPSWLGPSKAGGILLRRVSEATSTSSALDSFVDVENRDLDPLVPRAIRRRIVDDEHSAEHRRTTIAFVHVGGIDGLLRDEGPDAVVEKLDRIVDTAIEAAERFDVTLLATDVAGGGVKLILTAGVPDAVEDGEGRMLGVGRALVDAGIGLPVRVGVNTGHVFSGEVGAPWRRVYTVMGDAVNLSARLMAKARPGEVVANNLTIESSATPFETTPLEPFMVKGKRKPQHASSVGRRIEGRGRDSMVDVPFIGRAHEMQRLLSAMADATSGTGACIEIVGEPGIGKSRLVYELIAAAGQTRVVRVTCEPFAVDRPFFIARAVLRTALSIPLDATPHDASRMLIEWLGEHAPEQLPFAPLMAAATDAEMPSSREVDDLAADYRVVKLREVAAAVLHVAFSHPLVLVVEDAMWMDEASSLVLAEALQRLERVPWFACFTTRDPSQGLSTRLGYVADVLELEPLSGALAERLAAELTDDADVPQSELLELCARAKGNPLFLLELAHARRQLGSLDAIPASLEDLIGTRIDRLAPGDRNLLRHAAVLGDRFDPGLFERALGHGFPHPVPWQRLNDFIIRDQGELRFAHDLVRRVAYAGLPFRRRRELHLRIAKTLVPKGEPDDARLGLLALHFDGSGDAEMAWKYNRMAGERAKENYATVEATAFLERAIGHAHARADMVRRDELMTVYETLADVALLAGRFDVAKDALRGARKNCDDTSLAYARLCRKEGKLRERLGQHPAAVPWFRKGLKALEPFGDAAPNEVLAERARLQVEWAGTLMWRQKYRQSAQRCKHALPDALRSGDRRVEAHIYRLLAWSLAELGDPTADSYSSLAQPIYEELGDYIGLGALLINAGADAWVAGRWGEAALKFHDSRAAYQRAGDVVTMAQAAANLAEIYIEQGRFEEAETYLREARRVYRASGFALGIASLSNALGRTLAKSGRHDEGLELLHDSLQRCRQLAHGPYSAETAVRLAEGLLFVGRVDDAASTLDELGDSAAHGGDAVVALAKRLRGTVLARRGDVDGARHQLVSAVEFSNANLVEWESALAVMELVRLAGVTDDEYTDWRRTAKMTLERLEIDAQRVLPPLEAPAAIS